MLDMPLISGTYRALKVIITRFPLKVYVKRQKEPLPTP